MTCTTTVLTGVTGRITVDGAELIRITQWEVNPTMDTSTEWGDSEGAGYTLRAAGRKGATLTCEGKFDTGSEQFDIVYPGDKVTITLWQSSLVFWDMNCCLCTNFTLNVNVDTQEVQGWTADFGTDGIFYRPGEAGATASGTYPTA